jgi:hypothetical protein
MFEANFGKGEYLSVKWVFRKTTQGHIKDGTEMGANQNPQINKREF